MHVRGRSRSGRPERAETRALTVAFVVVLSQGQALAAATPSGEHNPYEARLQVLRQRWMQRAGQPSGLAPLAEALGMDEVVPPAAWREVVRQAATEPRADPLVAAQAQLALALDEGARGQTDAAAERLRALGFAPSAWVVGPFDGQSRSAIDQPQPPEQTAPDPVVAPESFQGKERPVAWRTLPGSAQDGALALDARLRPTKDVVAYLLLTARSRAAQRVALRLGSPGPLKVWCNGTEVWRGTAVRTPHLDQDAVTLPLARGENRILIKTAAGGDAAWRVFARFTALDGTAARGVEWQPAEAANARGGVHHPLVPWRRPRSTSSGAAAAVVSGPRARDLVEALRTRAERGGGAEAWEDYARVLAFVGSADEEAEAATLAARRALALGSRSEASWILTEVAREVDERRESFARLVTADPEPARQALARTGLAQLAAEARRPELAIAHRREALRLDANCWPAWLDDVMDQQNAGLQGSAWVALAAADARLASVPRIRRARARSLDALNRPREALHEWQLSVEDRGQDAESLQSLASLAERLGEPAAATGWLERAAALRPELPFLVIEAAQHRAGQNGGGPAAVDAGAALLRAAQVALPDEPALPEALGKLLIRRGDRAAGLLELRRSLDLRPQNPALRRYASRLEVETGRGGASAAADLAKRFAEDAEPLARRALRGELDREVGDAAAIVLLDRRVVEVHDNGLSDVFAQRLVQVRTERGARDNKQFYVRYTPGDQEVEIRRARLFRRPAADPRATADEVEVSEATGRDDQDLSEPWYGLYYDNRAQVVSFEGLRAGDIIEVQYTLSDAGARNELADYFGDLQFVAEPVPVHRWDYTLIGPRSRHFYFHEPALAGWTQSHEETERTQVHRFAASVVPRVELEPSMPGFAEVAPYFHVSTYQSWQDVGRWYWRLVQDQLAADEALRRAAREATAGLTAPADKVRALHALVTRGTRYVGLEFGIHGYKPYRVSQVLARRFGDCKDKASLLVALLREVGIAADLVLVRTKRGGAIASEPASLAVFDHAIAFVPSLGLYLDGTAEFAGMLELPEQDQGVTVLRVSAQGAELTRTPVLPSSANRAERRWTVALAPDGSGEVTETLTLTGQAAPEWRQHYETAGERTERYGKVWSARFPGTALASVTMTGLEERNQPVQVEARLRIPRLGVGRTGEPLSLPISARDAEFVRSYARLSGRAHDLVLAFPWQHDETLTYRLAGGARVLRAPAPRTISSAFGRFVLDVDGATGSEQVQIHAVVDVTKPRITPSEYPAFRRFLGAIDAALSERVLVGSQPTATR